MASVDHRSAAEIEREIEEDRSALARTLDEIQDRLSFESLSSNVVDRVRESSGDIGRTVVRGVRDHPVPIALTGAAILALVLASQRSSSRGSDPYDRSDPYGRAAATPASARWGGSPTADLRDPAATAEAAPLYDAAGRPMPHSEEHESRWDRMRRTASERGHATAGSVRSGASAAGGAVRSRAAGMSEAVRRRTRGAYASAAELRHRITEGTEHMPQAARRRVLAARTRAYEAQLRAEHYAARGREKATDFFEEQPLVAGALALAVGAAIGGLLPRTSREDEAFGAYRDQVFEEAERVYREERAKFENVARETASEARNVARDVARDVSGDVQEGVHRTGDIARAKFSEAENKAKEGANRVADTAKEEADKQNLGKT